MGAIFKKISTRPVPSGATITGSGSKLTARWKGRGKRAKWITAKVFALETGRQVIRQESPRPGSAGTATTTARSASYQPAVGTSRPPSPSSRTVSGPSSGSELASQHQQSMPLVSNRNATSAITSKPTSRRSRRACTRKYPGLSPATGRRLQMDSPRRHAAV